ncbi:hypothetical protein P7C70_g1733, partial [Phenoliferia sp. Uapishka_3]
MYVSYIYSSLCSESITQHLFVYLGPPKESPKSRVEKEKAQAAAKAKKAFDQKKKDEMAALFAPVDIVQTKVPFGVDPKTVLCAFFKAGQCTKGTKCKFSHDLNQERKQAKASIYADARDESKAEDTMDKWNDEKLQEVVGRKTNPNATTTDIVCKHFIDSVEAGRYGWFWECPDGGTYFFKSSGDHRVEQRLIRPLHLTGDLCKYRHALPPGFVLKSQRKAEEEAAKKTVITIEEFLEVERHKLDSSKLTPLTKETFAEWKKNRMDRKDAQAVMEHTAKSAQHAMGKANGMSGRDLFTFNPNLGVDSDDEGDDEDQWDLELLRIRTERDNREKEIERIRQLDQMFGDSSLEDAGPS